MHWGLKINHERLRDKLDKLKVSSSGGDEHLEYGSGREHQSNSRKQLSTVDDYQPRVKVHLDSACVQKLDYLLGF